MTGRAIAALVVGVALEVLALFGNRGPYPFVRDLIAPEYGAARQGYETLAAGGTLVEGDPGFSELRRSYMSLTLMVPEPPLPIDEIDGVTITKFEPGFQQDEWALKETTPVFGHYSTGDVFMLDFNYVMAMANDRLSRSLVLVNLAFLVAGGALVFYAFRQLFLRGRPVAAISAH